MLRPAQPIPLSSCPACGAACNAATPADGIEIAIAAGDITVCVACGGFSRLDSELRPVALTDEELSALAPEVLDELNGMRSAVLQRHASAPTEDPRYGMALTIVERAIGLASLPLDRVVAMVSFNGDRFEADVYEKARWSETVRKVSRDPGAPASDREAMLDLLRRVDPETTGAAVLLRFDDGPLMLRFVDPPARVA